MEEFYWLGLKAVPGVGNVTFRRLLERFDTPGAALAASPKELGTVRGVTPAVVEAIREGAWKRFADEECHRLAGSGARLVTFTSADYPKAMFEIPDPPPFLYVRGELRGNELAVAIVGSRRATSYGILTTGRLAEALAGHGVAVISGMARGVDTAAHKGAIQAGGRTIGVLGCGIDKVYPPENRKLFDAVSETGCLVSEFPGSLGGNRECALEQTAARAFSLTPKEAAVYELLARSPLHIDDIIAQTELTAGEVSSMLLHLELKGAVTPLSGKHFAVAV